MKKNINLKNLEGFFKVTYILGVIYFLLFNFNLMALFLSIFCLFSTIGLEFLFRKNVFKEKTLYNTLLVFLFFSSFLGSSFNFYKINHYDDFLHIWSGFICVSIAWNIFILFNKDIKLNNIFVIVFLFMFSMGCASIWEITEYLMDTFLNTNCQQGLIDTNIDMIDCMIGSIIMCTYYFKKLGYVLALC